MSKNNYLGTIRNYKGVNLQKKKRKLISIFDTLAKQNIIKSLLIILYISQNP